MVSVEFYFYIVTELLMIIYIFRLAEYVYCSLFLVYFWMRAIIYPKFQVPRL